MQLSNSTGPLTYKVWPVCIHVWVCPCLSLCSMHYPFQTCLLTCDKLVGKSTQEKYLLTWDMLAKDLVYYECLWWPKAGMFMLPGGGSPGPWHRSSASSTGSSEGTRGPSVLFRWACVPMRRVNPTQATLLVVLRPSSWCQQSRKEGNGGHHTVDEKTCSEPTWNTLGDSIRIECGHEGA